MKSASYVKIALLFIILGCAGLGYMLLSSGGISFLNTNTYVTVLSDASGLSTRSVIYLAGVQVGQVQEIQLIGNEARLRIAFLRDVEIREDALISLRPSSLLGTSVLNLNPGTELSPVLPPGSLISSSPPPGDLDSAMNLVQEIGGQISLLLEEFRLNQMAFLSVSLEAISSIAQRLDTQSEIQIDRISRILESTALITERTERILRESEGDIGSSIAELYEALANIRLITNDIAEGRGNLGQILYDENLYQNIFATVERTEDVVLAFGDTLGNISSLVTNADGIITDAGEIVHRALGLGVQVESNARYDFLSQNLRASASIRLEPLSNDRWYRIGVSSAPDGIPSRTIRETFDSSGNLVTWEDTTETRYTLGIDAELARKFGMFTLRGGLLENTAGIGLDLQPFNQISLSGELFSFRAGAVPNLRGSITYYPFFNPDSDNLINWIYLRGGISNSLSDNRDYFLGGGLRFYDREVRGLVGLLPVFN